MMYSVFCFLLASFLVVSSALPTGYYATSAVGRPQARAECAKVGGTLAAITLSNYHTFPEDVGVSSFFFLPFLFFILSFCLFFSFLFSIIFSSSLFSLLPF
eukprot:TRINITY_DN7192_c0_g1_i1.p1 TRINITY_DN7192_c0_g1~~TRINITY_DN7192_c0_g1_i1.p1  ORF type:complete len:101 (+),score=2.15 TRINITY_DN7192_c0_g1_i1:367-669(+)